MDFTLEIFWIEYTDFDNKNDLFFGDKFIWKSKDIRDSNSHFRSKNIHFLAPRFLVLQHVKLHQRFLLLVHKSVLG